MKPPDDVKTYYEQKMKSFGPTPAGVDWNGTIGQQIRFEQVCKVFGKEKAFSVLDYGCGYGAMVEYLRKRNTKPQYLGYDFSKVMIKAAQESQQSFKWAQFKNSLKKSEKFDYVVSSGLFNVKLKSSNKDWLNNVVLKTIDRLNNLSERGFSFNCLTQFSDRDKRRPHLYYANPTAIFNHCKKNYSKNVALLHDYNLFEFTIIVRK